MRVFLTGATGFIGAKVIPELLEAGHKVLGLTRSEAGAKALIQAGADPHRGALEDLESLCSGAAQSDAVIHCAFDHDFSNFIANCEKDARVIGALGRVLAGSDRPLVITSGVGVGESGPGKLAREEVFNDEHQNPRIASERAGAEALRNGAKVVVVRLPQVHDPRKQGLISPYIDNARERGVAAYVGDGANRWPAAPVSAVARLYRLAVEKGQGGERFHAVAEEGVAARDIAAAVGKGLGVPTLSLSPDQAGEHFGWLAMFMGMDMPASSAWTRQRLGWTPDGPSLLEDLSRMDYAAA